MPCGDPKARDRSVRKEVVDFHINETTLTETNKPADFSFHALTDLTPIGIEQARSTRLGEPPEKHHESRKFLTKGLWLNNNNLTNLAGLDGFVANIIDRPDLLTYIDLSFNRINKIDDVITTFKHLSVLYLHGNDISNDFELIKLYKLKKLRNITFHGNPLCESPHYRKMVLLCMPTIVHLDHCGVLKSERMQPPHPNALEMLRQYQQGDGKKKFTGKTIRIEDLNKEPPKQDGGDKHEIKQEEKESEIKKEKQPDVKEVKKSDVKGKKNDVKGKKQDVKEETKPNGKNDNVIVAIPAITKETIRKRLGSCKCTNH